MRVQWASLSSDGRLGHLLIHMQLGKTTIEDKQAQQKEIKEVEKLETKIEDVVEHHDEKHEEKKHDDQHPDEG